MGSKRCLIAFDIDNCLMPVNRPAEERTRRQLHELHDAGAHLTFASGKPCVYLSGLARGLGVMDCSLIGENGADIWVTSTMPPVRLPSELSADEVEALRSLRHAVDSRYGDKVFFQPNAVGVTAFPRCDTLTPAQVEREVNVQLPETISTYIHIDSVDWAVKRFNKGIALQRLAQHLGIPISRVAAAGDGANDLPMLAIASLALWLGDADDASGVTVERVGTVDRMMERLIGFAHEV